MSSAKKGKNMSEKPLNILFIHTDQQRADTLHCYGNNIVKTPNIDKLAQNSATFMNAHCTHPLCSPARASWITGEYIHSHGLWRNGTALDENRDNVVKSLAQSGYETCVIGKAHLMPYHADPALYCESVQTDNKVMGPSYEEVWDYWRNEKFENGFYGYKDVRLGLGHGDYGMTGGHYGLWVHENHPETEKLFLRENGFSEDTSFDAWKSAVPMEVHSATWITNEVDDYLKHNKDKKFFLSVGFQEPHPPFNPPKPYCDMYSPDDMPEPIGDEHDFGEELPYHIKHYMSRQGMPDLTMKRKKEILANYYGLVTLVDDAMGRIMDSLEKYGLADNTLIIFTSDHGDWMGDHNLNRKGGVHTSGLTKIPMIIKWPGVSKDGEKVHSVASQVDLAATIYDACNVKPHYTNQGVSLKNVLSGSENATRDYALIEHEHECYKDNSDFCKNVFSKTPQEKLKETVQCDLINETDKNWFMKTIVTDEYRFTYIPLVEYGELYDLKNDPNERVNLFNKDAELTAKAQKVMLRALIEATPLCQERKFPV